MSVLDFNGDEAEARLVESIFEANRRTLLAEASVQDRVLLPLLNKLTEETKENET